MTHLEQALRLAELGWKVFALGPTGFPLPNCRECDPERGNTCPTAVLMDACPHLVCHATYAGTSDPERLHAMWEHFPKSIIGIRTGSVSGIFVLDFDLHGEKSAWNAARQMRQDGTLPRTVAAETGGGGGHLYYKHPMDIPVPNNNRGLLGVGIDIKGDGGYVIGPPSAKRGKKAYCWVRGSEPWNRELACLPLETMKLITKSDNKPIRVDGINVTHSDNSKVKRYFEIALDNVTTTTLGSRNENLYVASCRGGEMITTGQLTDTEVIDLLEAAGRIAGLTESEIRQTIRSGLNRGANDFAEEAE